MISFLTIKHYINLCNLYLESLYPDIFSFRFNTFLMGLVSLLLNVYIVLHDKTEITIVWMAKTFRNALQAYIVNVATGPKEVDEYLNYFAWNSFFLYVAQFVISTSINMYNVYQKAVEKSKENKNSIPSNMYQTVLEGFIFPEGVSPLWYVFLFFCDIAVENLQASIDANYRQKFYRYGFYTAMYAIPAIISEFLLHNLFYLDINKFTLLFYTVSIISNISVNYEILLRDSELFYGVLSFLVSVILHTFVHFFLRYMNQKFKPESKYSLWIVRFPLNFWVYATNYNLNRNTLNSFMNTFLPTKFLVFLYLINVSVRLAYRYYLYYMIDIYTWIRWDKLNSNAFIFNERFLMAYSLGDNYQKVIRSEYRLMSLNGIFELMKNLNSVIKSKK